MAHEFLGVGWSFPLQVDEQGALRTSAHESSVEESIRSLLATSPGERVMRPDVGCQLSSLVFAANNSATAGLAARYVTRALALFEPRIAVVSVEAAAAPDDPARLNIEIEYRVIETNQAFNLVYPFYLSEGVGA